MTQCLMDPNLTRFIDGKELKEVLETSALKGWSREAWLLNVRFLFHFGVNMGRKCGFVVVGICCCRCSENDDARHLVVDCSS